jgi:hypothetical protein
MMVRLKIEMFDENGQGDNIHIVSVPNELSLFVASQLCKEKFIDLGKFDTNSNVILNSTYIKRIYIIDSDDVKIKRVLNEAKEIE